MKGSIKQVEWAQRIKYAVQSQIDSMLDVAEMQALNNNGDASFWIDHRNGDAVAMVWATELARVNAGFDALDDDPAVTDADAEKWYEGENEKVDRLIESLKARA